MGPLWSYLVQSLKSSLQASCCSLSVHWDIMSSSTSGTWSSDCITKKTLSPGKHRDSTLTVNSQRKAGWTGFYNNAGRWSSSTLCRLRHVQTCTYAVWLTQRQTELSRKTEGSFNLPGTADMRLPFGIWLFYIVMMSVNVHCACVFAVKEQDVCDRGYRRGLISLFIFWGSFQ